MGMIMAAVVIVWVLRLMLVLGLKGFWRSGHLWDGAIVGVGGVVRVSAV